MNWQIKRLDLQINQLNRFFGHRSENEYYLVKHIGKYKLRCRDLLNPNDFELTDFISLREMFNSLQLLLNFLQYSKITSVSFWNDFSGISDEKTLFNEINYLGE